MSVDTIDLLYSEADTIDVTYNEDDGIDVIYAADAIDIIIEETGIPIPGPPGTGGGGTTQLQLVYNSSDPDPDPAEGRYNDQDLFAAAVAAAPAGTILGFEQDEVWEIPLDMNGGRWEGIMPLDLRTDLLIRVVGDGVFTNPGSTFARYRLRFLSEKTSGHALVLPSEIKIEQACFLMGRTVPFALLDNSATNSNPGITLYNAGLVRPSYLGLSGAETEAVEIAEPYDSDHRAFIGAMLGGAIIGPDAVRGPGGCGLILATPAHEIDTQTNLVGGFNQTSLLHYITDDTYNDADMQAITETLDSVLQGLGYGSIQDAIDNAIGGGILPAGYTYDSTRLPSLLLGLFSMGLANGFALAGKADTSAVQSAIDATLAATNVGGVLSGDLLAPGFAVDMAAQSELDTVAAALTSKADLVGGTVPSAQLPSYVDDVVEAANLAAFPGTGESGKVYLAVDTNKSYRWSGSTYVHLDDGIALGETSATAYRGDRGKTAYDHSQATGNPHGLTLADLGLLSQGSDIINIDVFAPASNSGWSTITHVGGYAYGGARATDAGAATGAWVEWPVLLRAGTWALSGWRRTLTTYGVATVTLDGTTICTFENYAASNANSVAIASALSGSLSFTVAALVRATLRVTVTGQTSPSGGYFVSLHGLTLRRTGS